MSPAEPEVFDALRRLLKPYEQHLVGVHDTEDNYHLDAPRGGPGEKPLFFGSVRRGKQHISFHLMPVYIWPELLDGMSEELRRRMQGKSCFNFRRVDEALFSELAGLVERAFARMRAAGHVG